MTSRNDKSNAFIKSKWRIQWGLLGKYFASRHVFIDRPTELAKFKISKQKIGNKNKYTLEKAVIYSKKEIPTQRRSARKILFSKYQAQIFRQLSLVLRRLF